MNRFSRVSLSLSAGLRAGLALVAIGLLAVALVACGRSAAPAAPRPQVVTSFFPLYDFARAVAGEDFEVLCLVPAGGDPHNVDATPEMARTVAEAASIVTLGLGMDEWLGRMAAASGRPFVVAGDGLTTRTVGTAALSEFATEKPDPSEIDPHVWLDPVLARTLVERIAADLMRARPERREAIEARAETLKAELARLDGEFSAGLAELQRRQVVTFHGAFAYLFARYRLETVGVVELFPGDEPSAGYVRALVDLMRREKLDVIFAEPQLPDRMAQVVAREINGRVERLDPCESILPDAPAASYFDRQRKNLAVLCSVLAAPTAVPVVQP